MTITEDTEHSLKAYANGIQDTDNEQSSGIREISTGKILNFHNS